MSNEYEPITATKAEWLRAANQLRLTHPSEAFEICLAMTHPVNGDKTVTLRVLPSVATDIAHALNVEAQS